MKTATKSIRLSRAEINAALDALSLMAGNYEEDANDATRYDNAATAAEYEAKAKTLRAAMSKIRAAL